MALNKYRIELFFDVISPYSWFAFEHLGRYKSVWPIDVVYRPFHFPAVIKASKNHGAPLLVPAKAAYALKDMKRCGRHLNLDFKTMTDFEKIVVTKTSVKAQRALLAIQLTQEEKLEDSARALWKALFTQGQEIFNDEQIRHATRNVGLENFDDILMLSNSEEVKGRLRTNTDDALQTGCFGAPWMLVHTPSGVEPVFGSDRMPIIADMLNLKYVGPMNPEE